jgi:poly(hydroxyalkanoate) depolymerase family esterase
MKLHQNLLAQVRELSRKLLKRGPADAASAEAVTRTVTSTIEQGLSGLNNFNRMNGLHEAFQGRHHASPVPPQASPTSSPHASPHVPPQAPPQAPPAAARTGSGPKVWRGAAGPFGDASAMRDINPPPAAPASRPAPSTGQARPQPQAQPRVEPKARPQPQPQAQPKPQPQAQGWEEPQAEAKQQQAPQDAGPGPAPAAGPTTPQEMAQEFMASLGVANGIGAKGFSLPGFKMPGIDLPGATPGAKAPAPGASEGAQFLAGSYSNHAGKRDYKLYIPSSYHGQRMPLVVMLHGCTQNPDDFAAGTQMNMVAEEKQCFVVYPGQLKSANANKCWNWFNALDQQRDQGEPSIIAGIARHIMENYPVDERQVYVAGLSAGGAMAVIVGTLYPELFAAVGVHSGLPFASARDLPSALAAMRSGGMSGPARVTAGGGIPIIVFHGDRDTTVHPRNGDELIAHGLRNQVDKNTAPSASVDSGTVPNGYRYTRTTHRHPDGSPLGEHWVIHGAGHAWSGGSRHGSYTDGKGPDASREMMRFFETVS